MMLLRIIEEIEEEGRANLEFQPGIHRLMQFLEDQNIHVRFLGIFYSGQTIKNKC